eukprot:TRINITY_DN285_c0_g1_i1.p1 TRINITY_DN285_c0_g1~~TRINITY_DN285_c0_g1_i1.p1  ORF type:complete len:565 (+),score=195.18 TRINITY_DN285_c0_g1_i1:97-1695(+)
MSFVIDCGSDLYGTKVNTQLRFATVPTLAELAAAAETQFDVKARANRPAGYPDTPFRIETFQVFDDTLLRWVDLYDSKQLRPNVQLWCFQPESIWHSDAQGVIPDPEKPVATFTTPLGSPRRARIANDAGVPPTLSEKLRSVFFQIDGQNKGYLLYQDLEGAFRKCDMEFTSSTAGDLFTMADQNRSNHITYDEWVNFAIKAPGLVDALFFRMRDMFQDRMPAGQSPPSYDAQMARQQELQGMYQQQRDAEARARQEAEYARAREAERQRQEADARARQEADARARAEADRLRHEAEARARAEADRQRHEAEARARAEAERQRQEAEARARAEADARARQEAENRARQEAEYARAREQQALAQDQARAAQAAAADASQKKMLAEQQAAELANRQRAAEEAAAQAASQHAAAMAAAEQAAAQHANAQNEAHRAHSAQNDAENRANSIRAASPPLQSSPMQHSSPMAYQAPAVSTPQPTSPERENALREYERARRRADEIRLAKEEAERDERNAWDRCYYAPASPHYSPGARGY